MKISGRQLFWMLLTFQLGNTLLITLTPTAFHTRQDMWIAYAAAAVPGTLVALLAARTGLLYRDRSFVELCRRILGKWPGSVVSGAYLTVWFAAMGLIISDFADFAITVLLPTTPLWVLSSTMLLLMLYAVNAGGLRSIGRCGEFFGPIIVASLLLIIVLLIPDMAWTRILPVFTDSGFAAIARGAMYPYAFFSEAVLLLALVSFLDEPGQAPTWTVRAVAMTAVLVIAVVLAVVMTLGATLPAKLKYPTLNMISYINAMNFIQNLEIVGVLVWVLSIFVKLSLYLFLVSTGTARLLRIPRWQKVTWIVALAVFAQSLLQSKLNIRGSDVLEAFWVPYIVPIHMTALPLLLWTVGVIRRRMRRS